MKSIEIWEVEYDDMVGWEVVKEIVKKKLKSNFYIFEEDMVCLVEEINVEIFKVLDSKFLFLGCKVNKDYFDVVKMKDIMNFKNS